MLAGELVAPKGGKDVGRKTYLDYACTDHSSVWVLALDNLPVWYSLQETILRSPPPGRLEKVNWVVMSGASTILLHAGSWLLSARIASKLQLFFSNGLGG